jgi:hypothetical protein
MDKAHVVFARAVVGMIFLAGLAACGGGGSSDSAASNSPTSTSSSSAVGSSSSPSVTPANATPEIKGNPSEQVSVGQAYSFTPSASDDDGDSLTFSIDSKPGWATFNPATGQLSGTPAAADVGSHEEIAISVSDGDTTVKLAQFSIDVVQQSSGSVTLAWEPPTENTDGSPLMNLSGYKIYYGTQPGNYAASITLNNAGLTRHVVENLTSGTYFFAISALAANGSESDMSGEASKSI